MSHMLKIATCKQQNKTKQCKLGDKMALWLNK